MGTLDNLLRYKQQKDAEATADISAIPQALMMYQQAKQNQLDNTLKTLTLQGTLAKSGIGIGPNNQLVPDDRFNNASNRGVYTVDAQGNLTQIGTVPGKSVVKQLPITADQMGERSEKAAEGRNRANLNAPTAEIKNKYSETKNAELALQKLKELADQVSSSGWQGAVDIATGKITRGDSNPKLMQYLKEARTNAVSIYRAYSGDTRLSDADAEARAYPLLWNPTEGDKLKDISFSRLADVIKTRKSSYEENYGFNSGDSKNQEGSVSETANTPQYQVGQERNLKGGGVAVWDGKGWRKK
jgi:hypothetical protein